MPRGSESWGQSVVEGKYQENDNAHGTNRVGKDDDRKQQTQKLKNDRELQLRDEFNHTDYASMNPVERMAKLSADANAIQFERTERERKQQALDDADFWAAEKEAAPSSSSRRGSKAGLTEKVVEQAESSKDLKSAASEKDTKIRSAPKDAEQQKPKEAELKQNKAKEPTEQAKDKLERAPLEKQPKSQQQKGRFRKLSGDDDSSSSNTSGSDDHESERVPKMERRIDSADKDDSSSSSKEDAASEKELKKEKSDAKEEVHYAFQDRSKFYTTVNQELAEKLKGNESIATVDHFDLQRAAFHKRIAREADSLNATLAARQAAGETEQYVHEADRHSESLGDYIGHLGERIKGTASGLKNSIISKEHVAEDKIRNIRSNDDTRDLNNTLRLGSALSPESAPANYAAGNARLSDAEKRTFKGGKPGELERVERVAAKHPRAQKDYKKQGGADIESGLPTASAAAVSQDRLAIEHNLKDGLTRETLAAKHTALALKDRAEVQLERTERDIEHKWSATKLKAANTWESTRDAAERAKIDTERDVKRGIDSSKATLSSGLAKVEGGLEKIEHKIENGLIAIRDEAIHLKDEAGALISSAGSKVRSGVDSVKATVMDKAEDVKESASSIAAKADRQLDSTVDATTSRLESTRDTIAAQGARIRSSAARNGERVERELAEDAAMVRDKTASIASDLRHKAAEIKNDITSKAAEIKSDISSKASGLKSDINRKASSIKSDVEGEAASIRNAFRNQPGDEMDPAPEVLRQIELERGTSPTLAMRAAPAESAQSQGLFSRLAAWWSPANASNRSRESARVGTGGSEFESGAWRYAPDGSRRAASAWDLENEKNYSVEERNSLRAAHQQSTLGGSIKHALASSSAPHPSSFSPSLSDVSPSRADGSIPHSSTRGLGASIGHLHLRAPELPNLSAASRDNSLLLNQARDEGDFHSPARFERRATMVNPAILSPVDFDAINFTSAVEPW